MKLHQWICKASYTGFEEFIVGTIFTEEDSLQAALDEAYKFLSRVLPPGFIIKDMEKGCIIVHYGQSAHFDRW